VTLIAMLIFLGYWGSVNNTLVTWNVLFITEQYPLSLVMAVMLFSGFLLGMICTLYISSKVRIINNRKQRKAQRRQTTPVST
jgi:uncharacterized membrane protein YciS (DUF1049 family)